MSSFKYARHAKIIAVFAVAIILAGIIPSMWPGPVEGYSGDVHTVRYHLYQSEPVVEYGYNIDTGELYGAGVDAYVDVMYRGGVISTEYNPQVWAGTFKDTAGKECTDWYPISGYAVGHTLVFTGWVYAEGSGYSGRHYPGEVMSEREIEAATKSDNKIHVYATWDHLANYSYNLNFGTFSGGDEYTNMVVLYGGTYHLPNLGSSDGGLTIRGKGDVILNLYSSGNSYGLKQNTIIDSVKISGNFIRNHGDGAAGLYAKGHVLILGAGVDTASSSTTEDGYPETAYPQIVGGSNGDIAGLSLQRIPLGESSPTDLGTLLILHSGTYGNVVAGSRDGQVNGSTYVVLRDVTVLDTLIGACSKGGSVYGSTYVYATSLKMSGDHYEESLLNSSKIRVPYISESTIITGGSNDGSVSGNTHVYISGDSEIWDIQGAGRRGNSTVAGTAMVEVSGEAVVKHAVCGSITDGLVDGTDKKCVNSTDIRIKDSATVGAVFGAGYDTFYKANHASMMGGGTINVTLEGSCTVGYVYGGGYRGTIGTPIQPLDSVNIEIRGGTVLGDVFGGGRGGLDKITHKSDGGFDWSESAYDTTGFSIVYADHVSVTVSGGKVIGSVYGGGESVPIITSYNGYSSLKNVSLGGSGSKEVAAVHCDEISVKISGGIVVGDVYGSGKGADPTDLDYYDSEGKPVGKPVQGGYHFHSSAYTFAIQKTGAGCSIVKIPWISGSGGTVLQEGAKYSDFAKVDTETVVIIINNAVIGGSVYGGGEYGRLGPERGSTWTSVSIDLGKGAEISGSVFAGGYGKSNVIASNVLSRTVTIDGADIGGSVYGGSRYGDDNCSSSNGSVSTSGYYRGNATIRLISGDLVSGSSGSVYGGGYRSHSNMDTEVLVGVPAMAMGQNPAVDYLRVHSVYGGASVGESEDYDNDAVLLLGDSQVILGNLWGGSKETPYVGGGFSVSGDVFGKGDYCSISGKSLVEFRGFVQGGGLLSVQKSDELNVIGSELNVIGNVDGSSSHASEKLSLNLIQGLILMKDRSWGPSTISLHSAASQIGAYASLGVDGQPDIPKLTGSNLTMNAIDMYGGMIFSILGKDNRGDEDGLGDITGYTLIGNGGSGYYGTFAMGVTSQVQVGTTGFIVEQKGRGYVAAQEASYNYSGIGVTMWYIEGVYKVEGTVVLQDNGGDGPSETVTVIVPKTVKGSSIQFVGGYVNSSSPGSLNLVDRPGSTTPGKDFVVTVGRVSDAGYIHFGTGGQTAMPDSSVQFEGNGMYLSIDVSTNGGYINTGYVGSVTLHMVEIMGSIPINTFDVEVGVYLRAASTTENITNILVMRPKDEGGSNDYIGSVDVYLPVLAHNAMAGYTLGVESVEGSISVVASPTNLHKNGWQSVAVDEPTSINVGDNLYMGVGGVFAPVLTFNYGYGFGQTPQEVKFGEIKLTITLTEEITGKVTRYGLTLKPEPAVKLDLTFKDKYLTYDDSVIGWSDYTEILTIDIDFGTDMSNVYVAVNGSFWNSGNIGSASVEDDADYIGKVADSISRKDGLVLLPDDDGFVFGSKIYVDSQIREKDYKAMLVSDFLDIYVKHKPYKQYGREVFHYSDHPGWYDTSECMTPFNFESVITNDLNVYAGYGIAIYIVPFTNPKDPDEIGKAYAVYPEYILLGKPGTEVNLKDVYETLTITSGYDKVSEGTVWWYKDLDGNLKEWDLGSEYTFKPQADFKAYLRLERIQYSITLVIDNSTQTFPSDYTVSIGDYTTDGSSAFYGDHVSVSFAIKQGYHIGSVIGTVPNGSFDRFQISSDDNKNILSFTMPAGNLTVYVTTTDKNTVTFELSDSGSNDNRYFGIQVKDTGSELSVTLVQGLGVSIVTVSTSTSKASVTGGTNLGTGGILISAYVGDEVLCTLKESGVELKLDDHGDNTKVSIHVSVKWRLEISGEGYEVQRDALSDPKSGKTISDPDTYSSYRQCAYVLTGERLKVSASNEETLVSISYTNLRQITSAGGTFEFSVPGTGNASIRNPVFRLTLTIIVDFRSGGTDVSVGDWAEGSVSVSKAEDVILHEEGGNLVFRYLVNSGEYAVSAGYAGFIPSKGNPSIVVMGSSSTSVTLVMTAIDYRVGIVYPAENVNYTRVWHVCDPMEIRGLIDKEEVGLSAKADRWFGYTPAMTGSDELDLGQMMTIGMFGGGTDYTVFGVLGLEGMDPEEPGAEDYQLFIVVTVDDINGSHRVQAVDGVENGTELSAIVDGSKVTATYSVSGEGASILIVDCPEGTGGLVLRGEALCIILTSIPEPEGI